MYLLKIDFHMIARFCLALIWALSNSASFTALLRSSLFPGLKDLAPSSKHIKHVLDSFAVVLSP